MWAWTGRSYITAVLSVGFAFWRELEKRKSDGRVLELQALQLHRDETRDFRAERSQLRADLANAQALLRSRKDTIRRLRKEVRASDAAKTDAAIRAGILEQIPDAERPQVTLELPTQTHATNALLPSVRFGVLLLTYSAQFCITDLRLATRLLLRGPTQKHLPVTELMKLRGLAHDTIEKGLANVAGMIGVTQQLAHAPDRYNSLGAVFSSVLDTNPIPPLTHIPPGWDTLPIVPEPSAAKAAFKQLVFADYHRTPYLEEANVALQQFNASDTRQ